MVDTTNIERFLRAEVEKGGSEASVASNRCSINRCLREAREDGIDLDDFGPDEMRRLASLASENDALGRSLALFGRYVFSVTGEVVMPGLEGAKLEAPLKRWLDHLRGCGVTEKQIAQERKLVRRCFRLLWDEYGDLDPMHADVGTVPALERKMENLADETRRSYMSAYGRFVGWCTGVDPYRESIRPKAERDFDGYIDGLLDGCPRNDDVRKFADHLLALGYRQTTVRNYVRGIGYILVVVEKLEPNCDLRSVDMDMYIRIRMAMVDVATSTLKAYLRSFAEFVKFTTGNDDYCERRLMLNEEDVRRVFLDREDWDRLVEEATPEEMVILSLGGGMGLRRMEIADLRLDDFVGGKLRIRGKGHGPEGKVVLRDVPGPVAEAVEAYLPVRRRILEKSGDRSEGRLLVKATLFVGEPMSPDNVGDSLYRLSRRTGVKFSAHSLRRLYATTLYELGTDEDTLRRLMRHASVNTTLNCYIRPNEQRQREAQRMLESELFGRRAIGERRPGALVHREIRRRRRRRLAGDAEAHLRVLAATFMIPLAEPTRDGYAFLGRSVYADAASAEYCVGGASRTRPVTCTASKSAVRGVGPRARFPLR